MLGRFFLILLLIYSNLSLAIKEDHATLTISKFNFNNQNILALTIEHEKHWHTYWKNPGDSGIPTKFSFKQDGKEIKLKEFEWPAPQTHIEAGDILTYGYEGTKSFFFDGSDLSQTPLEVKVDWLICKDICIPGGDSKKIIFSEVTQSSTDIINQFKERPQKASFPKDLEIYLSKDGEHLVVHYVLKNTSSVKRDSGKNLLTPFPKTLLGFKQEKLFYDQENKTLYGEMKVEWDGEYQDPSYPLPLDGVFKEPLEIQFLYSSEDQGPSSVIKKTFTEFSLSNEGISSYLKSLKPLGQESSVSMEKSSPKNFLLMVMFALLGGLILNLMPCVLPVITLKLFELIKHREESKKRILEHNLLYTAGVIVTFWVLALVIVLIKSTGERVGWGFQLQSPLFLIVMIFSLFIFALNMFGLFEFSTPGGRKLANLHLEDSFTGDFLSGVLSTILSTPCSAPFLGTALTFAFTTSTLNIFFIFTLIGIGLAFPFIITAFFPQALKVLPKPGLWMEKMKYFLGFSLALTSLWLVSVFFSIVDMALWFWPIMGTLAFVFFAFFAQSKITKHKFLRASLFIIPFIMLAGSIVKLPFAPPAHHRDLKGESWQAWSPQTLSTLNGEKVFMDFTAEWCLTCKVNKKLVLDTEAFDHFIEAEGIKLLRGDWTKRDEVIAKFLEAHGAVSVPAYFIQRPSGEIIFLGETISIEKIEKAFSEE